MLLERAAGLASLHDALQCALAGSGRLVFVIGEAGVGKTSLVAALGEAAGVRMVVRRGRCDNVSDTAEPLGALVDALPELATETGSKAAVFRRLRTLLVAQPTLLVLEDVHWADEATLDALRYLGGRQADAPLLVIATLRDEALARSHPLAVVLGDLATAPGVHRVSLAPLSLDGVRALVEAARSPVDPVRLFERTSGNPFFVTEVVASGPGSVPETIRDAVLARTARLRPSVQQLLAAAAVLGPRAELDLLVEVSGGQTTDLDSCVDAGMLIADPPGWSFRHELAREAVEQSLAPTQARELHRRAYAALRVVNAADDRLLAHHAGRAGDRAAVLMHAPRAAQRSATLGAHREAAEFLRASIRAETAEARHRAELYRSLSYECYLTDQLDEALTAQRRALELSELAGDDAAVGAGLRWLSRLSWFLGRNHDSERYADRAIEVLEPAGDSHELAMAYSNQAQLRMLAGELPGAVGLGQQALAMGRRIGDVEVEIHSLNNIGTALVAGGDSSGRQKLQKSLDLAIATDAHEHAARAYTNLGTTAAVQREHAEADQLLRRGMAYCQERDLDSWQLYMAAWLARSAAEQGRLPEARTTAETVLATPHLSPISRVVAAAAAAQAAMRLGDDPAALLDEALEIALSTTELQRLVPVAAARAEAAWLTGRAADISAEVARAWPAVVERPEPWALGELAWWAMVGGERLELPIPVAGPFAAMLESRWDAAAALWTQRACPLWAAVALTRCAGLEDARLGFALAADCGAVATVERLRRDRHGAGLPLPRGPRPSTRANPAQLSRRESDVLALLAEGASNADIAAGLVLSEKTVAHHVSAVLRKLGEPTRARAVTAARRSGMVP